MHEGLPGVSKFSSPNAFQNSTKTETRPKSLDIGKYFTIHCGMHTHFCFSFFKICLDFCEKTDSGNRGHMIEMSCA